LIFLHKKVLFRGLVPDAECSICAARSYPVAVWRKVDAVYRHLVLLVRSGCATRPDVPDFHVRVFGPRSDQVGILEIYGEAIDSCPVTSEAHFLLVGCDVPKVNGAALGARDETVAVIEELNFRDFSLVPF
jgi:hypothetical protein